MNFNSIYFAIFTGLVFFIYWSFPNRYKWIILLISSCYFYIGFGLSFFILLCIITGLSYLSGFVIEKSRSNGLCRIIVIGAITAIIYVLLYFKCSGFLAHVFDTILKDWTMQLSPAVQEMILPVGISFYSFKAIGYIIDVYRGQMPEKNWGKFAVYMFFFPEVVSGPIDRSDYFFFQIAKEHEFSYERVSYGLKLVAWGLFKKIIVADTLAFYVDWVFDSYRSFVGFSLLLICFFFTIQIYCDFSGYSDMAIGLAKMLDIEIMDNFKSPYFSTSVREFWRRWHISLSTWFRDYLYIPLGGNRKGRVRKGINLLLTFLVSGFWHGADLTFILWGGLHGAAQILEDIFRNVSPGYEKYRPWKQCFKMIGVFIFCSFAWIFFRADTMTQACYFFAHMWDGIIHPASYLVKSQRELGIDVYLFGKICIIIATVFIFDLFNKQRDVIDLISGQRVAVRWTIYSAVVFATIIFLPVNPGTDFLYFHF